MSPSCFVCGKPMNPAYGLEFTWKCRHCDVVEERSPLPFVNRVTTIPEGEWGGTITYLDHSAGHYPSPG